MIRRLPGVVLALGLAYGFFACSRPAQQAAAKPKSDLPPEPVVNHQPSDAEAGQTIAHGELIVGADSERQKLHAQHHSHKLLETRRVPGRFETPAMKDVKDFYLSK